MPGKTKPITRRYFTGPSHFVGKSGETITPSVLRNNPMYFGADGKPKYLKSDGTIDVGKIRNNMLLGKDRRLFNEFPNKVGSVPFELAIAHLNEIARVRLRPAALQFEVKLAKEAVDVFQRSFVEHKFRDYGSQRWQPLAPYTVKRRRKFGTNPNNILVDTGTLKRSIHQVGESGRVITDPKMFGTARRHKGVCYAGVHNDPAYFGAYNYASRTHQVVRRQFMGHSSYLKEKGWELSRLLFFEEMFTPIV